MWGKYYKLYELREEILEWKVIVLCVTELLWYLAMDS